jgi:hypothetical protein
MTPKDIRSAISRKPFMPFTVNCKSGQQYLVSHPEAIWQAPAPDDETVIIHVRDVGIVLTDAEGINEIVLAGKRTAASSAEGPGS